MKLMPKPFRVWNAFENYYTNITGLRWHNGNPFVVSFRVNNYSLMEALVEPWTGCYENYPEEMFPLSPQPIYVGDIVEVHCNSPRVKHLTGEVILGKGSFHVFNKDYPSKSLNFYQISELDIVKIVGNINRQRAMADLGGR